MKTKPLIIGLLSMIFVHVGAFGATEKTEWEYKIINQGQYGDSATKELNLLGAEGWEVVAVVPASFANGSEKNSIVDSVRVFLKRQKR
jgi:hypothetical protein